MIDRPTFEAGNALLRDEDYVSGIQSQTEATINHLCKFWGRENPVAETYLMTVLIGQAVDRIYERLSNDDHTGLNQFAGSLLREHSEAIRRLCSDLEK